MAVSKKVRFEVFKRDNFTCAYCGKRPPDVMLQVDHIVPSSKGGSDEPGNLATSCQPCNAGKSDRELEESHIPTLSENEILGRIQEAMEQQVKIQESVAAAESTRQAEMQAADKLIEWWWEITQMTAEPERESLGRFAGKMDIEEIVEAMRLAAGFRDNNPHKSQWEIVRYFYGICWAKIRGDR